MLKTGDVFVLDEKVLDELLAGAPILADVRQGKSHARKTIEDAEATPPGQVVLRVERVGRAKARKPAFDCDFGDDERDPS